MSKRGGSGAREVRAPRGTERTCRGWIQEAALRMLHNNLDPDVAEGFPDAKTVNEALRGLLAIARRTRGENTR